MRAIKNVPKTGGPKTEVPELPLFRGPEALRLRDLIWPGGMRGAVKSAAPRRGAGRVLNFGIYSSDSSILEGHRACRSRLPNDHPRPSVFILFLFFLPISFFYNFLTCSTPFLPVPDPLNAQICYVYHTIWMFFMLRKTSIFHDFWPPKMSPNPPKRPIPDLPEI